jgi:hypothetical protein
MPSSRLLNARCLREHGPSDLLSAQGIYVPPRRRQVGGTLLDAIVTSLSDNIQPELRGALCRTLQLDGWDKDVEQLINGIISALGVEEFLGDYNATGKSKDVDFCTDLIIAMLQLIEARYPPEDPNDVVVDGVVTDNPSVHQACRPRVKAKWPKRIFLYSCWLHGVSKLIEDIFKLPFFKDLMLSHKLIVRKVRRKQWIHSNLLKVQKSEALRAEYTDAKGRFRALTVKRMGETRIGSAYGMMKRNYKLAHAFEAVAADPSYNKKCGISNARAEAAAALEAAAAEDAADDSESASDSEEESGAAKKQGDYLEVKRLMKCEDFQSETLAAIEFLRPIMQVLRVADRQESQHAVVWDTMARLDTYYSEQVDEYTGPVPSEQVSQVHGFVVSRWAYLHDMTHSAAYALNPHFHGVDVMAEQSVMEDLYSVFSEFYSDEDDQVKVALEFMDYKTKGSAHWKKPMVWLQAKLMAPSNFWVMHGSHSPLLRPLALCVLLLNHAAGGAERNWSAHDFLCGKRRASTGAEKLSTEVYYYMNQRMLDARTARGRPKKRAKKFYNDQGVEISHPEWADKWAESGSESD